MRRALAAGIGAALLFGGLTGCSDSAGTGGEAVSVEPVSMVAAAGSLGLADRYAGMVVSGETAEVKRDSNKTVLEIYVKEGDMVREGDPLYCYDSEKIQLDLDMLYLDRANYDNTIAAANAEIGELDAQRASAKDADKLSYTLQIDSRRADIREAEYNRSVNERKIASMEAALENTEITAPISGRVMTVDEEGGAGAAGYYEEPDAGEGDTGVDFITITDVAHMRIQGNINELNAAALTEGLPMRIRSRVDQEQTWTGVLSEIDWENPVQKNDGDMYSGSVMVSDDSDSMTAASKYPFYIELDDTDGLMLGQHVYIEPDTGDGDEDDAPAGPMLPSYYVVREGDDAYVWADDDGKLEKRAVTLGEYDETADAYEIETGLALTDYIAFPEEGLEEGRSTERYDPAAAAEEGSAQESREAF